MNNLSRLVLDLLSMMNCIFFALPGKSFNSMSNNFFCLVDYFCFSNFENVFLDGVVQLSAGQVQ